MGLKDFFKPAKKVINTDNLAELLVQFSYKSETTNEAYKKLLALYKPYFALPDDQMHAILSYDLISSRMIILFFPCQAKYHAVYPNSNKLYECFVTQSTKAIKDNFSPNLAAMAEFEAKYLSYEEVFAEDSTNRMPALSLLFNTYIRHSAELTHITEKISLSNPVVNLYPPEPHEVEFFTEMINPLFQFADTVLEENDLVE